MHGNLVGIKCVSNTNLKSNISSVTFITLIYPTKVRNTGQLICVQPSLQRQNNMADNSLI